MAYAFMTFIQCLIITLIALVGLYFLDKLLKKYVVCIPMVCFIVSISLIMKHLGSMKLLTEDTMVSQSPILFLFIVLIIIDIIPALSTFIYYLKLKKKNISYFEYKKVKIRDL